ncbi:MAG TPA: hypothetical protein VF688_04285 [Allosphingosinicella sp.]
MSALLLAACAAGSCLPPPESAERTELRVRLQPLIHRSQCPGPPTPAFFQAQEIEYSRRKAALIERVGRSPAAEDLVRTRREDEEMNRNVTEAECNTMFWDRPDDPENVAAYPARLRGDLQELRAAEAAFERVVAACEKG